MRSMWAGGECLKQIDLAALYAEVKRLRALYEKTLNAQIAKLEDERRKFREDMESGNLR